MSARALALWCCLVLASPAAIAASASAPAGLQRNVVFAAYSPLAGSAELMRRLMSPLEAMRLQRQLVQQHQALREQSIDLRRERFVIYVPTRAPPANGFALLVFVPPWKQAVVPQDWIPALDGSGTIFVSANDSGNDADVLDRREPLALLAAYNIMRRYRIDPQRVYVGGFSGGSKVALRLALAYPDLFRGALLEAGSEPIGSTEIPLPPADLFHAFQQSARLVFLTGERDDYHRREDAHSRDSLKQWCMFNIDTVTMPRIGHELADRSGFIQALHKLAEPASPDGDKLTPCRAAIAQAKDAQLRQAQSLLAVGKPDQARKLLEQIDARYGGLATPGSIQLMEQIDAQR
ncbi:MAG TPA: PHB depolymerase family esterase [Rhodanobacteraceae bacterium]|nr:PHB depolymerase family esterase [Rhodanobacteraceae bacterium]